MTFEEYQRRISSINRDLEIISKRTANMAVAKSAVYTNPEFEDLMKRFEGLVTQSEKLTQQMENSSNPADGNSPK